MRLNFADMQISNFLNIGSVGCTETATQFKMYLKLLNIEHGESRYSHELTTYKVHRHIR